MLLSRRYIYAIFFLFAFALGAMLSRIADIQHKLQIEEGLLGFALVCSSLGMLAFLTFGAPLVDRFGPKRTFLVANIALVSFYILVSAAQTYSVMVLAMVLSGVCVGALEISANVEADRLEASLGRRIMNRCHGFWSLGFCAAALAGGIMRQFDIAPVTHILLIFPVVVAGTVLATVGQDFAVAKPDAQTTHKSLVNRPTPYILMLCIVSSGPLLAEGAGIDWSVIYMRDSFETGRFTESASLIGFTLVMAITRFFADSVVDRFGAVNTARLSLAVTVAGVCLIGIAPNVTLAIVGFMLTGAGSSIIYPLAVSAATRRADRPASANVASLAQTSFLVFFIGPALLGFVAEHTDIRLAFMVSLPLLAAGLFFADKLAAPAPNRHALGV